MQVLAKLNPGVSRDAAAAELRSIAAAIAQAYPERTRNTSFILSSLTEETVGSVRGALKLLLAAVLLVLLIACSNVTSLLLRALRGATNGSARACGARRQPGTTGPPVRHRDARPLLDRHDCRNRVWPCWLLNLLRTVGPTRFPA